VALRLTHDRPSYQVLVLVPASITLLPTAAAPHLVLRCHMVGCRTAAACKLPKSRMNRTRAAARMLWPKGMDRYCRMVGQRGRAGRIHSPPTRVAYVRSVGGRIGGDHGCMPGLRAKTDGWMPCARELAAAVWERGPGRIGE